MTRQQRNSELPPPDADASAHSARVRERILGAIDASGGRLTFDRYMTLALYEPGLGYYSAGQARFGSGGDYTTAPLMSALFSRTLARQTAEVLERLNGGDVLEFGAGTGRMAADVLLELDALDRLPDRYFILEVSGALREEQQRTLDGLPAHLTERVTWLERLPDSPLRGVVLANEVLDALPVKRLQADREGLQELVVVADGDGFGWEAAPAGRELTRAVGRIESGLGRELPPGYVSEWCPGLGPWIRTLASILDAGAALLVDYGYPRSEYYHPQRAMGTLLCHYRHRAHDDPFVFPGLQDITAFVDFSAAADAAAAAGLEVIGFNTQAHFLMSAGLPALIEDAAERDPDRGAELAQQAKPLLFPDEMGERFKVLGLGRSLGERPLAGFSLFDHRHRL